MRIRRRFLSQTSSDPSIQAPNAPKLEESSVPAAGSAAELHPGVDLLKGLLGWRRRADSSSQDPTKFNSPHRVFQEEKKMVVQSDSHKTWNPQVCSENRSAAMEPYEETGDKKPMVKAEGSAIEGRSDNAAEGSAAKKRRSPVVLMEGSRCSRVNGRGWRCCQQTMVGYALCEHHLGKGRLRSMNTVWGLGEDQLETGKGRGKMGMMKARSISSLINEGNSNTEAANSASDVYNGVVRLGDEEACDPDVYSNGATQPCNVNYMVQNMKMMLEREWN